MNRRYDKWVKEEQWSHHEIKDYISMKIYPEDLEILITLLMPKIFEVDGLVFFDVDGKGESFIREAYSKKDTVKRSSSERQKDWNSINVRNIFFNTQDDSIDKTIMNIAKLIKHNWEYYLIKSYPNINFIVEIYGDSFEPYVSFYQNDL